MMIRRTLYLISTLAFLLIASCARQTDQARQTRQKIDELQKQLEEAKTQQAKANEPAKPSAPVPPPPPREHVMAAGSRIEVRTTNTLSTKTNKTGETFVATLTKPIVQGDWVIAEKGATVEGRIVESDPGGRVKGKASMAVALTSLTLADGRKIAITTGGAGSEAKSSVKKDAVKVGVATGVGAAIGAIAGGGKGAAIGAGVGGGAGSGAVLMTRGDAAVIPSESVLTFELSQAVKIIEKK